MTRRGDGLARTCLACGSLAFPRNHPRGAFITLREIIAKTSSRRLGPQAALLLPIFGSLPSFAIPFIYTLADLGTTLAILEVAKNKASDGQSTSQSDPLQSWWIALL